MPIPGAVNFRHFGGYATEDGRRVKQGRLYRSGSLAELTEQGRRDVLALNIGVICDLRRPDECRRAPTPFPEQQPRRVSIPMNPGSAADLHAVFDAGEMTETRGADFMVAINREMARDLTEDFVRVFHALAEVEEAAFLVHCSAGKDRTGFAVALILRALGVPKDVVMTDYLLTNDVISLDTHVPEDVKQNYQGGVRMAAVRALWSVRREYLQAAFDEIQRGYESVDAYIQDGLGIDTALRKELERRLVV